MDDLFKKVINTGVGLLAQGNKRVQTALDKLVQESKLSEQEGQKIMDDLRKSGEAKRQQFEKQVQDLAGNLRGRVGLGKEDKAASSGKAQAVGPKAAPKKPTAKAASAAKKSAPKSSTARKDASPASEG